MGEFGWYLLFLFVWVFFQSLWLSKLNRQVIELEKELTALRSKSP